jgi:CubicO group peptidase (beta-lactamase class C family)
MHASFAKKKIFSLAVFAFAIFLSGLFTWSGCAQSAAAQSADAHMPDDAHLKAAADYNFAASGQTFLVMKDGKIVAEQYGNGGSADRRQMLASGSKSFVGLTAVAAVQDGLLKLDDPVCEAIAEWRNDPLKSKITYRQLLTLTSGLTAGERGHAVRGPAWADIAAKPMTSAPGEKFDYGAYHLNTFAYALERKLNKETFEAYLKRRILDPLSITVEWRFRCDDGHPQVGGGAFMTARDWATFGEMIKNGGRCGDRTIVNPALLEQCFQGSAQNPTYGLTWWLKKPVSAQTIQAVPMIGRDWGAVSNARWLPQDLVAARGAGNQRLYVMPSLGLVVVRQASFSGGRRRGGALGGNSRFSRRGAGAFAGSRQPASDDDEGASFSDFEFLRKLLGN